MISERWVSKVCRKVKGLWFWTPLLAKPRPSGKSLEKLSPLENSGLGTTTQFVCFLLKKILICLEGRYQWSLIVEDIFLLGFFHRLNSYWSLTSVRAFWADTVPFKGPQLCLICCFRNCRDTRTVPCVQCSAWRSQDTVSNWHKLDCAFVKKAPICTNSWLWKAHRIELS